MLKYLDRQTKHVRNFSKNMQRHKLNVKTQVPNQNNVFDQIPLYDYQNNPQKPIHRDDQGFLLVEMDGKFSFSWNNYQQLQQLIHRFGPFMNDQHIAWCAYKAWMINLPYDSLAETVLLKMIMDKVPNFNQENGSSLAMLTMGMAGLGCQNKKFWKLIETKFVDEGIYRHIPLNQAINMLHTMAMADVPAQKIYTTQEQYFIKHRNQLNSKSRELLQDIQINSELSLNPDILVPLLVKEIQGEQAKDYLQEESRRLKRAKLDKLGSIMRNVKPKEEWALNFERRLGVFKESLKLWQPTEEVKSEVDARQEVFIRKVFWASDVDLDHVKNHQEAFLNSFMQLCNQVQAQSTDDESQAQQSIVESMSVLQELVTTYNLKDGSTLRGYIISTYEEFLRENLKDDFNLNSQEFLYTISKDEWSQIFDCIKKSKRVIELESKKAEVLLLSSIVSRQQNKLDKNDLSLFEERIGKVVEKLSLLDTLKLQMLSSLSSEYQTQQFETAKKVEFVTSQHTHLFPMETEEDAILNKKAQVAVKRDQEFLKKGESSLLEQLAFDDQSATKEEPKSELELIQKDDVQKQVLDVSDIQDLQNVAEYLLGKLPAVAKPLDTQSQLDANSSEKEQDSFVKNQFKDTAHGPTELYTHFAGSNINISKLQSAVNTFYRKELGLDSNINLEVSMQDLGEGADSYERWLQGVFETDSKMQHNPLNFMRSTQEHVQQERRRSSYLQQNVDERAPVDEGVVETHSLNPMRIFSRHSRRRRPAKFRTRVGNMENDKLQFSY